MSNPSWGGRFAVGTDEFVNRFQASIGFDQRLYAEDIAGSIAHAAMLGERGIIAPDEAREIVAGLEAVRGDIEADPGLLTDAAEDIHMNVETLLRAKIGPVAGKLHTARSRNDQVATDTRLWVKAAAAELSEAVAGLQGRLVREASGTLDHLYPGTTHLQHAQPVRMAHHLLAYFWMLQRDRRRLAAARAAADALPLGAGALAGTTFPIDREQVRAALGFAAVTENSMDAVSDRDYALDLIYACSMLMMHLSRLSEELVLWSTPEYGYVAMGDAVTTGSSIMPQKKNPDVPELVRGKTGRVYGDLLGLLTTMKGLPLAYNKDTQEDKEPLFDAADTALACAKALSVVLDNIVFRRERMAAALRGDFSTATDLADYLASRGLPFREAHEVVGRIVADCIGQGLILEELAPTQLAAYSPLLADAPGDIASPEASAERRAGQGGTGRAAVQEQLRQAEMALEAG